MERGSKRESEVVAQRERERKEGSMGGKHHHKLTIIVRVFCLCDATAPSAAVQKEKKKHTHTNGGLHEEKKVVLGQSRGGDELLGRCGGVPLHREASAFPHCSLRDVLPTSRERVFWRKHQLETVFPF